MKFNSFNSKVSVSSYFIPSSTLFMEISSCARDTVFIEECLCHNLGGFGGAEAGGGNSCLHLSG